LQEWIRRISTSFVISMMQKKLWKEQKANMLSLLDLPSLVSFIHSLNETVHFEFFHFVILNWSEIK
jgi:hypothetical protein